jgi:hypothetical protein
MGLIAELVIPAIGAILAVAATLAKNWSANKSMSDIVITMGDGSKITVEGSDEAREKVRKILSDTLKPKS